MGRETILGRDTGGGRGDRAIDYEYYRLKEDIYIHLHTRSVQRDMSVQWSGAEAGITARDLGRGKDL